MAKSSRHVMTLADYLVIAISPALIMTLIGSLVFFLLEVSYSGQYRERMLWVLGWFVLGSVLIARIAIQEGRQHAALFGIGLGAVTALFAAQYADQILIALVLLAIIWWCAGKLTWDCTLIDDSQDASGEGLVQAAQLSEGPREPTEICDEAPLDASRTRPHAPGRWLVYFSLAALPLFGVGQLFIPHQDAPRRAYGFQLLMVYVASGLGLLLATSFLGLRRYLRQRNLQMPPAMAVTWLIGGSVLASLLLLIALLIPRPQGEYTLTALIDRVDQRLQQASRFALIGKDKGQGEGNPIGKVDPEGKQSGAAQQKPQDSDRPGQKAQNEADPASGEKQDSRSNSQSDGAQSSDKSSSKGDRAPESSKSNPSQKSEPVKSDRNPAQRPDEGKSAESRQNQQQEPATKTREIREQRAAANPSRTIQPPPSGLAQLLANVAPFFKWLVYGVLFLIIGILLIAYRQHLFESLARLWHALMNLFRRQVNQNSKSSVGEEPEKPKRLFSSFTNPFSSGTHLKMPPATIVVYSFDALTAWASERNLSRGDEQTPLEFAEQVSRRFPELEEIVQYTARLYGGIAYGSQVPHREAVATLKLLWTGLERTPRASSRH